LPTTSNGYFIIGSCGNLARTGEAHDRVLVNSALDKTLVLQGEAVEIRSTLDYYRTGFGDGWRLREAPIRAAALTTAMARRKLRARGVE
jgi:hypothetical protein